jgi:tetratricopeptide (TPR) repeat protein
MEIQNAFNKILPDLTRLERIRDYDGIFPVLNKLRQEYTSRDHDGWLDRSIMSHEASILVKKGQYSEALDRLRAIANSIPTDHPEFLPNQLSMAHVLEKKDDWQGALLELEVGLRGISDKFTQSAFRLLVRYATIAAGHQMGVPLVYRDLFLESARSWGISVTELLADPRSLGQTILSADIRWREAQDRYITLLDALRAHREKSSRRKLIQDYIDQEPLGYFRMMAQEILEEGPDPSDKALGK